VRHKRAGMAGLCATALTIGMLSFTTAQAAPTVTVKDVENSFHRVEAVVEDVNRLKVDIKATQADIDDLNADIARDQASYDEQRDTLSAAIVSQQMDAPLGPTVNLLGSANPEEFLDGLGAVQALNSSRADALEKFGAASAALRNRRAQLQDRQDELKQTQKATKAKQAEIRRKYEAAKAALARLTAAQQRTFNTSNVKVDFEVDASGRAKKVINFALAQLGDPYKWGGNGPNAWDCSGLTQHAFAAAGISIPRVVGPQYAATRHISMSALRPGDMVFYGSMSHVGIYLGNGRVVHAPSSGKRVRTDALDSRYWKKHLAEIRRL